MSAVRTTVLGSSLEKSSPVGVRRFESCPGHYLFKYLLLIIPMSRSNKKQDVLATPTKNNKMYVGIGFALATAGLITWSSYELFRKSEAKRETYSQQHVKRVPLSNHNRSGLLIKSGATLEIFTSSPEQWIGTRLTLDEKLCRQWAYYAPVNIRIPELDYSATLPVEDNVRSAETQFSQPAPLAERTYHYVVTGRDPQTQNAIELWCHVLQPRKR